MTTPTQSPRQHRSGGNRSQFQYPAFASKSCRACCCRASLPPRRWAELMRWDKLESSECQLLLLDRSLPDLDAEELLQIIHQRFPGIDVLLLDDAGHPCFRRDGAAPARCICSRPSIAGKLPHGLASTSQASAAAVLEPLPGMVGQSPCMAVVYRMARLVAPRTTPVLITGATRDRKGSCGRGNPSPEPARQQSRSW